MRQARISWFGITATSKKIYSVSKRLFVPNMTARKDSQVVNIHPFKNHFVRQKGRDNVVIIRMRLYTRWGSWAADFRQTTVQEKSYQAHCTVLWKGLCDRQLTVSFRWEKAWVQSPFPHSSHLQEDTHAAVLKGGGASRECWCQAKGLSDFKMASASWQPLPFMCSVWPSML